MILIQKVKHGQYDAITASLQGERLPREEFNRYLRFCSNLNMSYNSSLNSQIRVTDNPLHLAKKVISAFKESGYEIAVTQEVADMLKDENIEEITEHESKAAALREIADKSSAAIKMLEEICGKKLFAYQYYGSQFLMCKPAAMLCDEMGLGKTIQALMGIPYDTPALVICPNSVKGNWGRECLAWRPDLEPIILYGRESFRWPGRTKASMFNKEKAELLIMNYDIMPMSKAEVKYYEEENAKIRVRIDYLEEIPSRNEQEQIILQELEQEFASNNLKMLQALNDVVRTMTGCPDNVIIIADEAHMLKGDVKKVARCKRFDTLSETARSRDGIIWFLTGTPIINRPDELWNLLVMLGISEDIFESRDRFGFLFNERKTNSGQSKWGKPQPGVIETIRKFMLCRKKVDVLEDLPEKIFKDVYIDLDSETQALADDALEDLKKRGIDIKTATLDAIQTGIEFSKISLIRSALSKAKIPTALQLVEEYEEEEQKLLVFSAYRPIVDLIGERDGWAKIAGDVNAATRSAIEQQFATDESMKGVALTIKAGGFGLNLQSAYNVLMADLEWSPSANEQAIARADRIGQKSSKIFITRIIANHPLEHRLLEILDEKMQIIANTVGASAQQVPDIMKEVAQLEKKAADLAAIDVAIAEPEATKPKEDPSPPKDEDGNIQWDKIQKIETQSNAFYPPRNEEEIMVAERMISMLDNHIEFAAGYESFGESLALSLKRSGRLSAKQWAYAAKIVASQPRPPKSQDEMKAIHAVLMLRELSQDGIEKRNDMGFCGGCLRPGLQLAAKVEQQGLLSDVEWAKLIKIANHHRKQTGFDPTGE